MTPRKKLVKKLDTVFSLYIRDRDKKCCTCGSVKNLTCGHLITRSKYSTRWNERNAFAQCKSCNFRHEYQPEIMTSWYIKKFGAEQYQSLVRLSNEVAKFSNTDLEMTISEYQKDLIIKE